MRLTLILVLITMMLSIVISGATGYDLVIHVYVDGAPASAGAVEIYNGTSLVANASIVNGTASFTNISAGSYQVKILVGNNTYTYNITVDANHTSYTFNITTTSTATSADTGNDTVSTGVLGRVRGWWSSLDLRQKAAIAIAGLLALFILAKKVV